MGYMVFLVRPQNTGGTKADVMLNLSYGPRIVRVTKIAPIVGYKLEIRHSLAYRKDPHEYIVVETRLFV